MNLHVFLDQASQKLLCSALNLQPTSDVFGCNVYSDGSAAAIDTWNPSGTMTNVLDKDQVS